MHYNLNIHDPVGVKKLINALTDVVPPVRIHDYRLLNCSLPVCILVYIEFFLYLLLAVK